jgi:hypothetical protein
VLRRVLCVLVGVCLCLACHWIMQFCVLVGGGIGQALISQFMIEKLNETLRVYVCVCVCVCGGGVWHFVLITHAA